jgi:hypothetical protein
MSDNKYSQILRKIPQELHCSLKQEFASSYKEEASEVRTSKIKGYQLSAKLGFCPIRASESPISVTEDSGAHNSVTEIPTSQDISIKSQERIKELNYLLLSLSIKKSPLSTSIGFSSDMSVTASFHKKLEPRKISKTTKKAKQIPGYFKGTQSFKAKVMASKKHGKSIA